MPNFPEIHLVWRAGCSSERVLTRWPHFHDGRCTTWRITGSTSRLIVRLFQTLQLTRLVATTSNDSL